MGRPLDAHFGQSACSGLWLLSANHGIIGFAWYDPKSSYDNLFHVYKKTLLQLYCVYHVGFNITFLRPHSFC